MKIKAFLLSLVVTFSFFSVTVQDQVIPATEKTRVTTLTHGMGG